MLRDVYSPAARKAIRAELGKDVVNLPVHEIEKQLSAANTGVRGPRTHGRKFCKQLDVDQKATADAGYFFGHPEWSLPCKSRT
jgi:hypothetical protein